MATHGEHAYDYSMYGLSSTGEKGSGIAMKNMWKGLVLLAGIFICLTPAHAISVDQEIVKIRNATDVLNEVMGVTGGGIPRTLLEKAQAIAVIPDALSSDTVLGSRYGVGVMVAKTEERTWSRPAFVSISGTS